MSMGCSRMGEQNLPPLLGLLDTSESGYVGVELSTSGTYCYHFCIKDCRQFQEWKGGGDGKNWVSAELSVLFWGLHPYSVQDVGQSETDGREHGGVKRRTRVRIFKVKDQLLKWLKKLFIIEKRTLKA